jgi:hypothetical protein
MVLPYLKGLIIIKCGFSILLCGSIVYSVFVVIIFVFRYLVLNKWYQSTFLGQTLWANIFYFCRFFFFRRRKKRAATFSKFSVYLCEKFVEKGCISEFLSEKHPI